MISRQIFTGSGKVGSENGRPEVDYQLTQRADFFEEELFCHGHTYAYHALALSAIPAAIGEYKKLVAAGTMERVAAHLKTKLFELADRHPCVGDVRGIGHF